MFGKQIKAEINGDGNIIFQGISDSSIVVNPDDIDEVRKILIEINQQISSLPLDVLSILEEKSQVNSEIKIGANLSLTVMVETRDSNISGVSWSTTITNLTKEIRYFNLPYFKVSPKFKIKEGVELDTFVIMQHERINIKYPYRLEFGQTVSSMFPINSFAFKKFEEINTDDAYIQAFVTTTIGEIYSSRKFPISEFVNKYKFIFGE